MKKSYIISIVIGIFSFCLLFLVLNLNVFFSIFISLTLYYALTLIFGKNGELDTPINESTLEYEKLYGEAKSIIKSINALEAKIDNKKIQEGIVSICDTSNKILVSLKDNPKKINQVRKFVDYYLPFTLNILNQYNTIEDQALTSKESKDFMQRVEVMLDRVKEACEAQLNNMYTTDLVNTNADIKVFETMLKTDGLVDDNMNIIKVKEKEGE